MLEGAATRIAAGNLETRVPDVGTDSVGRLAAEKNLDLLLRCHQAMRQVCPGLKLVVVGDGPERDAFQQACPGALLVGARGGTDVSGGCM